MPKLLQDGVLIMPQQQQQNSQQYFYNDADYYQQSNVKNLIVKHIDQNLPYTGYSSPIGHYDYTQTMSNTESLRSHRHRRRSSSKSRDNSLIGTSPHRQRQYNHRDDYSNTQPRSRRNEMIFNENSRKLAYQQDTSKITVGETISSTNKIFTGNSNAHSRTCPNYKGKRSAADDFKGGYYDAKQSISHREREATHETSRAKYFQGRSGFEELDYIINSAKHKEEKSHRFKSTDTLKSRNKLQEVKRSPRHDSSRRSDLSNLQSRSTTVLDETPFSYFSSSPLPSFPQTTAPSFLNDQQQQKTINDAQMPILVPLPLPDLEIPQPPQIFQHLPSFNNSYNHPENFFGNDLDQFNGNNSFQTFNNQFNHSYSTNLESFSSTEGIKPTKRKESKNETLTTQKPPKPLRSPSLNLLDDHKLSKTHFHKSKREPSPKKIENNNDQNGYSKMYLAEPARVVDLDQIGQISDQENFYENNKELQNQPETFYSKSYVTNKSVEDFYKENLKRNNEINQHNNMINQSVQTQTDKIYDANGKMIEKSRLNEQTQGFVRNNSDILNTKYNRSNNSSGISSKILNSSNNNSDTNITLPRIQRTKKSDTPILDALTALMSSSAQVDTSKQPETKKDFQQIENSPNAASNFSSASTSPDPTDLMTEYQTSIFIGKHYSAKDVTVNLDVCDDQDEIESAYKLTIHCFKRDGNAGGGSTFKKETNPSCLKKESKREIILPPRANVKTLESFLDEGYLHFTCQVNNQSKDNTKSAKALTSSSFTNITTTEPSSERNSSSDDSGKLLHTLNSHILDITNKSLSQHQNQESKSQNKNLVFENPLYTKQIANNTEPATESSTNELIDVALKLGKGIQPNKVRTDLASNSYGRITDTSQSNRDKSPNRFEDLTSNETSLLQRGRSYSLPSSPPKSVKFDMKNNVFHINKDNESHRSRNQRSLNRGLTTKAQNKVAPSSDAFSRNGFSNIDLIKDGFNCITKDGLENVYLTYFFKLPSCSPSDRTQVRIENHNVLKLKIIQEKTYAFSKSNSKCSMKQKIKSKRAQSTNGYTSSSASSSTLASSSSSSDESPSLTSSEISSDNARSPSSSGTSLTFSLPSTIQPSSITMQSAETLPNDYQSSDEKIMLREFSRRCKLPNNVFRFDENGITVSFVNNIWVRVEIPILEILGSGLINETDKKTLRKKSNLKTEKIADEDTFEGIKKRNCVASPIQMSSNQRKTVFE